MTDPFATGGGDFLKLDDLAANGDASDSLTARGRHVLFAAETIQKDIPGDNGHYDAVFGKLVLLDGEVTESVPEVPMALEDFRLTGGFILPRVQSHYRAVSAVPAGRENEFSLAPKNPDVWLVLGLLVKEKNSRGTGSWKMVDPTADGVTLARAWVKANPKPDDDPFA